MSEIINKLLYLPKLKYLLSLIIVLVIIGCSGKNDAQDSTTSRKWLYGGVTSVGQTENFLFFVDECIEGEDMLDQIKSLIKPIQGVYEQVTNRLGVKIIGEEKTAVIFACKEATLCSLNGQSRWDQDQSTITIFANKGILDEQVLYISAHEIAHLLQWKYNGEGTVDPILVEGWATLAAEPYLIDWIGVESIDHHVKSLIEDNHYVEFNTSGLWDQMYTNTGCQGFRLSMYMEWASFVGYIINTYGVEKLIEIMSISSSSANSVKNPGQFIGTGQYETIFGKSLQELENDWFLSLRKD